MLEIYEQQAQREAKATRRREEACCVEEAEAKARRCAEEAD
jgi:hypothetical protein